MEYIRREIIPHFCIDEEIEAIRIFDSGHINNTYQLQTRDGGYVLQQINHYVFKNPEQVMSNIISVTNHIKEKILMEGGDVERGTLHFIPTKDGEYYYKTPYGEYYRVYKYISGVKTYQIVEKPEHFYNAACAFGKFQNMLADFPADSLYETIENFHHTPLRYKQLDEAIANDPKGRAKEVKKYIDFAMARRDEAGLIVDGIASEEIKIRVTHNDTKLNNVLIDKKTNRGICVIDLDTVMPGSMLYDFGDSIRFGTNTSEEDEPDLDKVHMNMELYRCFAEGYLSELKGSITEAELKYMPFSAKLMTLECGIRFLADYINGDLYFKIDREGQNLDRTGTQFKLVTEMEKNMKDMEKIIDEIMNS